MNRKQIIVVVVLILIVLVVGKNYLEKRSARLQREELARELGLDPQIHAHDQGFFIDYFYETLSPGMPISQVHQIVKGYKSSFACKDDIEMYYYYSTSDKDAMIFIINYQENARLKSKEIDYLEVSLDPNSRWLPNGSCRPGILD